MTPELALTLLAVLGYVRYCPTCDCAKPVTAFEVCPVSIAASGEPYASEYRRGTCASCRARRARVRLTPMEIALGIRVDVRPAREYRRQAA